MGSGIEYNHTIISRSLSSSNSFPSKYHQVGHKYIFPWLFISIEYCVFLLFVLVVFISFIEIKPKYPQYNFEHTTHQPININTSILCGTMNKYCQRKNNNIEYGRGYTFYIWIRSKGYGMQWPEMRTKQNIFRLLVELKWEIKYME